MRFLGLILALAAIGWVLTRGAGEGESGVVPQGYQDSLEKAEAVEGTINEAAQKSLEALDRETP